MLFDILSVFLSVLINIDEAASIKLPKLRPPTYG